MVSGIDEHGTPIQVQADAEGMSTRALADRYSQVIVEDFARLGLTYDLFTRTTTRNHYAVVQELFATLHRNGYIVAKTTMGAISPSTGRTLPDRYIEGTCPICGYDSARGDHEVRPTGPPGHGEVGRAAGGLGRAAVPHLPRRRPQLRAGAAGQHHHRLQRAARPPHRGRDLQVRPTQRAPTRGVGRVGAGDCW